MNSRKKKSVRSLYTWGVDRNIKKFWSKKAQERVRAPWWLFLSSLLDSGDQNFVFVVWFWEKKFSCFEKIFRFCLLKSYLKIFFFFLLQTYLQERAKTEFFAALRFIPSFHVKIEIVFSQFRWLRGLRGVIYLQAAFEEFVELISPEIPINPLQCAYILVA